MPPEVCPNCGASVPRHARACRECGADESTGWSESAHADNLNLPDDHFDYGEFVKNEFGSSETKPHGLHWIWWFTALLLVILFLFLFFR